jgi:hypothetical protein
VTRKRNPAPAERRGRSKLDLILDRVERGKHEVTLDVDGYTDADVARIVAAAKARGLQADRAGRFVLIRDMRENPASSDFWSTPAGTATQIAAGVGVVAGVYLVIRNWGPTSAAYELPVATSTLLESL